MESLCLPPTLPPNREPRFLVPAGSAVVVSKVSPLFWHKHTTKLDLSFDRHEYLEAGRLCFRHEGYLIQVPKSLVKGFWLTQAPLQESRADARAARLKRRKKERRQTEPGEKPNGNAVCRDCKKPAVVKRYAFFNGSRPRCTACGGSLDYLGSWRKTRAPRR